MAQFDLRGLRDSIVLYDLHYNPWRGITDSEANGDLRYTLKAMESKAMSAEDMEYQKTTSTQRRRILYQLVIVVIMYSVLLYPCLHHILGQDQHRQSMEQELEHLDKLLTLQKVLLNMHLELLVTNGNMSTGYHQQRLDLDSAILGLDDNLPTSAFIFGTLVRTRRRFIYVVSVVRREVDEHEISLPEVISKYSILLSFMRETLQKMITKSEFNTDVKSVLGMLKTFEMTMDMRNVLVHLATICTLSDNTEWNDDVLLSDYTNKIVHILNAVMGTRYFFDLHGTESGMSETDWHTLLTIRQHSIRYRFEEMNGTYWNKLLCNVLDTDLKSIILNVTELSNSLFMDLVSSYDTRHADAIMGIVIDTIVFVIHVGLAAVVVVVHRRNVDRIMALGRLNYSLEKESEKGRERTASILLDIIPEEFVSELLHGITKPPQNTEHNHEACSLSLKSRIDALKLNSVAPVSSVENIQKVYSEKMNNFTDEVFKKSLYGGMRSPILMGVCDQATLFVCDFMLIDRLVDVFAPDQLISLVTCLIQIIEDRTKLYNVHVLSKNIDTFAVISGIYSHQHISHVYEIANMALDILATCSDLEVNVFGNSKLRMRISIHTSSCIYSLSSYPEPRFHITGGIAEIAIHLLKNCYANRIHICHAVAAILRKEEHVYDIQRRGFTTLPTGRRLDTYWLLGRRVSVCEPTKETVSLSRIMQPLRLEQRALYRFDSEKIRYVRPAWTVLSTLN